MEGQRNQGANTPRSPPKKTALRQVFLFGVRAEKLAGFEIFFELVHQRPIDRTGSKIRHVQVRFEPLKRLLDQLIVLFKDRAVAG